MSKVWFIKSRYNRSRGGKYYRSEKEFFKNILTDDKREFSIFEEVESGTSGVYKANSLKEKDRDIQLRSVLGELNKYEEAISNFIKAYTELSKEEKRKSHCLKLMIQSQLDKKIFSTILISNKRYFISEVSTTIEWYKLLLRCHNFVDCRYSGRIWDNVAKKSINKNTEPKEIVDNFLEAKKQLRKK